MLCHSIWIAVVDEKEFCIELVAENHLGVLLSDSRSRPKVCRILSLSHVFEQSNHLHPVENVLRKGKKMTRKVIAIEKAYPVVHVFVRKER